MPWQSKSDIPDRIKERSDTEGWTDDDWGQFLAVVNPKIEKASSNAEEGRAIVEAIGAVNATSGCDHDHEPTTCQAPEGSDVDPERFEELSDEAQEYETLLDEMETDLRDRLRDIAIEHKRWWKRRARDEPNFSQRQLAQLKRQSRRKFRPQYQDAVFSVARKARQRARELTIEHSEVMSAVLGEVDEPTENQPPTIPGEDGQGFTIVLSDLVDEIYNRQDGVLSEQIAQQERATPPDQDRPPSGQRKLDRLSDATLANTADKAVNPSAAEGRHDAVSDAEDAIEEETGTKPQTKATRNAVLDENTCDPCEDLHGETFIVGSDAYFAALPPNACNGGPKCRCWMEYEFPDNVEGEVTGGATETSELGDGFPVEPVELADTEEGRWATIFQIGQSADHPNGSFEVTEEFARGLLSSFQYLKQKHDYRPPLLRDHRDDGTILGEIVDMRLVGDRVQIKPDWVPSAQDLVDEGRIDRLSPSFFESWTDPETGETLSPVLREVSAVSIPHLKSLPSLSEASESTRETFISLAEGGAMRTDDDAKENMPQSDLGSPIASMIKGRLKNLPEKGGEMFPGRMQVKEQLADAVGMSVEEFDNQVLGGDLVFPPDDVIEGLADAMGVEEGALRRGAVEGMSAGDDSASEGGDGGEADEPSDEPPLPAPSGEGEEQEMTESCETCEGLRRELAEKTVASDFPEADGDRRERLVNLRARDADAYTELVEMAGDVSGPAPTESDEQTNGEEIGTPGSPSTDGADGQLRELAEQAAEKDIERGKPLAKWLNKRGIGYDEIDDAVIDDAYT